MARLRDGQYRLSVAAWPSYYVYMQDSFTGNVASWRGDPGPQGYWQLVSHPNHPGYYLLSTRRWPDCFIFMENSFSGNIRGWSNCDPGSQGNWKLVPVRAKGGEGYYYLVPQAWEHADWFVYMESWIFGNLSAWKDDPGPQGWFKIESFESKDTGFQMPLVMTSERLATMPRLGDHASGYSGPSPLLSEPQLLSEIRLEVVKADDVNFSTMHPTERSIIFHVDQSRRFIQMVGRQAQQAFFDQFVPNRDLWSCLSRSIFELRLEPPATSPTLLKLSQNGVLCIGGSPLKTNESRQVQDGTIIGLGASDQRIFLEMRLSLRRSSTQEIAATQANLRRVNAGRSGGGKHSGYSDMFDTRPPASSAPRSNYPPAIRDNSTSYDAHRSANHFESRDYRRAPPGPSHFATAVAPSPDFATAVAPSPSHFSGPEAILECIFSAGISDLSMANVVIPLRADKDISIGRQEQPNFFEKLLPSKEDLQYISRSHMQAHYNAGRGTVEIMNLSQNPVRVDARTLQLGQKGEMMVGSSLKFLAGDRTLVSFMLKFS